MNKNINSTFCMLKPDICERNLVGDVLSMIEKNHFKIVRMEMKQMSVEHMEEFYKDHSTKFFFRDMVDRITKGLVVGCVLEYTKDTSTDAIAHLRVLMGATNPTASEVGTIRRAFGISIDENSIHGSDSSENFLRETKIFFGK
jgi:nucleoside-diphosphate kinase